MGQGKEVLTRLEGHVALGLIAGVRKKPEVSIAEYKAAMDAYAPDQEQTVMVRLAAAYNEAGKPDEAIAMIEKINAMPNLMPAVKQIAASERAKAMKAKGGAAPPAAAPAPAPAPAEPARSSACECPRICRPCNRHWGTGFPGRTC